MPDAEFQAAASPFTDNERADLAIAIGRRNAYDRMAIGFRTPSAFGRRWQRPTTVRPPPDGTTGGAIRQLAPAGENAERTR